MRRTGGLGLRFLVALVVLWTTAFQDPCFVMGQGHRGFRPLKVYPVDEAKREPSLLAAREALLEAISHGDAEHVKRLIDPSSSPAAALVDALRVDANQRSAAKDLWVWTPLKRALSLGGAFTTTKGAVYGRREFCAPYAYANWPPHWLLDDMRDPDSGSEPWMVIGQGVAVRLAPSIQAPIVSRVSFEVLPVAALSAQDESGADLVWQRVILPDGRHGFVADSLLWGDMDYHVCFANVDGQWRLTKFAR